MLSLLEKLHLGHLKNFQHEKVTVDQICKLSDKQIECLGVNYRKTMMTLMLKYLPFGNDPPPRKPHNDVSELQYDKTTSHNDKMSTHNDY